MTTKNILYLSILLFSAGMMRAQEPVSPVRNAVRTTVPIAAVTSEASLNSDNSLTAIQYTDGLGRPNITVAEGITPEGKDLVSMVTYDVDGNPSEQWLPAPVVSNGSLPDPETVMQSARTFYNDNKPFSSAETNYGLVHAKIFTPPGTDWHDTPKRKAGYTGMNRDTLSPLYQVNKYKVVGNGVQKGNRYFAGSLTLTENIDEDGKKMVVFYDLSGKLILERKVFNESGNVFYDTYRVYDDKDNLRFVLSPEASYRMTSTSTVYAHAGINTSNNPIDQYSYIYRYDGLNRCIAKKNPGADWVYSVYDKAGRLVLSQDGNQRTDHTWSFRKYDKYGRVIQEGTAVNTKTHDVLRSEYENIVMTETWSASGYSNVRSPGTDTVVLSEYYYDNYDFLNLSAYASVKTRLTYTQLPGFDAKFVRLENNVDISTRGMQTGVAVSLTDQSGKIVTVSYFDDKRRAVQTLSNNHVGGYEKHYYGYNFTGAPAKHRHVHKASLNTEIIEEYAFTYDKAGRLKAVNQTVNSMPTLKTSSYRYDEAGRVKRKYFFNDTHSIAYTYNIHGRLKSLTSDYFSENIRYQDGVSKKYYNGSIAEIDEISVNSNPNKYHVYTYDALNRLSSEKFRLTAGGSEYDSFYNFDRNGNMTVIQRKGFVQDLTPRPPGSGSTAPPVIGEWIDLLQMSYAGNRLTDVTDSQDGSIVYRPPVGNMDFRGRTGIPEKYLYDANGNQTGDFNKGIAWIKYNVLNLPYKVQMENGNKNEYLYDASGIKRKTTYSVALNAMQIPLGSTGTENTAVQSVTTRDYCENIIYKNGVPERIITPDGYILAGNTTPSMWMRIFQIKDHAGNVRAEAGSPFLTYTSGTCAPNFSGDYYPYGQEATPKNGQSLPNPAPVNLYAGNEFERTNVRMYDFHARWYDQQTGRFGGQDPLAEDNYSVSPYIYCDGDPINFVDPWGLKKGDPDDPFGPNDYGPYDIDFEPSVTESPGKNKKKGYGGGGGGSFGGGGAGGYFGDFDNPFITQNPALSALYEKEYAERERLRQEMMKLQRIEEGLKVNRDLLGPIVMGLAYVSMLAESTEEGTIRVLGVVKVGWKVGEPITNLTAKGNVPAWSTVRQRFWKNEALLNGSTYSESNLLRMQKGLAPQFQNPKTGLMESMELHHTNPQRNGGLFEFIKVTPEQHRSIDPFRR